MELPSLVEPPVDIPRLVEILEGLGHEARVHCIRTWTKPIMRAVYDAAEGHAKATLAMLVPDGVVGVETICEGQNTVPVFSHFQKRFARNGAGDVVGYNHNARWQMRATGPGYFTTREQESGEIVFDYTVEPTGAPPVVTWPRIGSNSAPRSLLIYGGLVDYVRALGSHVFIGVATRRGKDIGQYFALVRV